MNDESLATLYKEVHRSLLNWLQQRVNSHAVAEDLLQSIFLKALQAHQRGDDINNPSAWIYHIARNTLIDYYRQKKDTTSFNEDLLIGCDDGFVDKSLTACLQPLIRQLPDKYQQTILAIDLHSETIQSLADQEQVSLSAIKSRLSRGRQQLKQQLFDCCNIQVSRTGEVEDFLPKATSSCLC
jgi:RNA polymerase sigma-70 factor (ECF subfamily)